MKNRNRFLLFAVLPLFAQLAGCTNTTPSHYTGSGVSSFPSQVSAKNSVLGNLVVNPPPKTTMKEHRLQELLRRYRGNEINPAEYHFQRARILAEGTSMSDAASTAAGLISEPNLQPDHLNAQSELANPSVNPRAPEFSSGAFTGLAQPRPEPPEPWPPYTNFPATLRKGVLEQAQKIEEQLRMERDLRSVFQTQMQENLNRTLRQPVPSVPPVAPPPVIRPLPQPSLPAGGGGFGGGGFGSGRGF